VPAAMLARGRRSTGQGADPVGPAWSISGGGRDVNQMAIILPIVQRFSRTTVGFASVTDLPTMFAASRKAESYKWL
jgi:hypothetical protein